MVINGGSRAGTPAYTSYLGAHLQRSDTNERVHVREMSGVAASIGDDLTAALREMSAVGEGSRSQKPLYHANIDWRADETLTEAQKDRAIDRLAEELGLANQPRVVIEHVKDGREHLHVVWSRIDGETLCAIPDSHNFRKHEIVARELEREFGHERVQGAHHERDGVDRPARAPTLGETRQAERSGLTAEEARAQLRDLWQAADSGQAFAAALDDAGWILAQGDKRGYVALDPTGEVRAVNKAVTGLSAAQVRERLGDLEPGQLPTVDQARERMQEREPEPAPEIDREAEEQARLEAMAQDIASREYDDDTPGYDPERDDGELAQERDDFYEAIARAEDAALDAEMAEMRQWWTDYKAEQQAARDELDAIHEDVRAQFRQQREALNEAERQAAASEYLAEQTRGRGDDSALDAARAMEDMARTDHLGAARHFGHHAGDRLKSPEEMRREWADLMRGGRSAEQMEADWKQAEREAAAEHAPDASFNDRTPDAPFVDPAAGRASWAERLRGFAAETVQEARQEAKPDRQRERSLEPESPTQAPETERPGLFQKVRDFVRGWFEAAPQPAPQPEPARDRGPDRQRDVAGDREAEAAKPMPAKQPAQKQGPKREAEQERPRPAERAKSASEEIMERAKANLEARLARETPQERASRERAERDHEADLSRGRGDGSRERTRHHHTLLWELLHPFHDHSRHDHHAPRRPEP